MYRLSDLYYQQESEINREEIFLNGIKFFISTIMENPDRIKVIVSDSGRRLYQKLVSDNLLDDIAYTDIDLAGQKYLKRKNSEECPMVDFITSNIGYESGEEEQYNIDLFFKKIRVKKSEINKSSVWLNAPYIYSSPVLIDEWLQWRFNYNDIMVSVPDINRFNIDIMRYINGKYHLHDDVVEINSLDNIDLYGDAIILNDFSKKVYLDAIKIINKRGEAFKLYAVEGSLNNSLFLKEYMIIKPKNDEEKRQLDSYVDYGYLIRDRKEIDKYYLTNLTMYVVPIVFSQFDADITNKFWQIFRLNWRDSFKEQKKWIEYIKNMDIYKNNGYEDELFTDLFNFYFKSFNELKKNDLVAHGGSVMSMLKDEQRSIKDLLIKKEVSYQRRLKK